MVTAARDVIMLRGGLYSPDSGIMVDLVTKNEGEMVIPLLRSSQTPHAVRRRGHSLGVKLS